MYRTCHHYLGMFLISIILIILLLSSYFPLNTAITRTFNTNIHPSQHIYNTSSQHIYNTSSQHIYNTSSQHNHKHILTTQSSPQVFHAYVWIEWRVFLDIGRILRDGRSQSNDADANGRNDATTRIWCSWNVSTGEPLSIVLIIHDPCDPVMPMLSPSDGIILIHSLYLISHHITQYLTSLTSHYFSMVVDRRKTCWALPNTNGWTSNTIDCS